MKRSLLIVTLFSILSGFCSHREARASGLSEEAWEDGTTETGEYADMLREYYDNLSYLDREVDGLEYHTSFIHSVGKNYLAWKRDILPDFRTHSFPPQSWMEVSVKSLDGLWLTPYQSGRMDWEFNRFLPTVNNAVRNKEYAPLMYISLKPGYKFLTQGVGFRTDSINWKIWKAWSSIPGNLEEENEFTVGLTQHLKGSNKPWHSAFYEAYKIAGFESNGWPVLLNLKAINHGKLMVPNPMSFRGPLEELIEF